MPGILTPDQEDILCGLVLARIGSWGNTGRPKSLTLHQAVRITLLSMAGRYDYHDIAVALGCGEATVFRTVARLRPILVDIAFTAALEPVNA